MLRLSAPSYQQSDILCLRRRVWQDVGICLLSRLPQLIVPQRIERRPDPLLRVELINGAGDPQSCVLSDIRRGDLVEAIVSIEIAVVEAPDGIPRTSVFFSFSRVTRLYRAMELRIVRPLPKTPFAPWLISYKQCSDDICVLPEVLDQKDYRTTGNIGFMPYVPAVDVEVESD